MGTHPRIRSFVRRDSRLTDAQRHALDVEWPRFRLPDVGCAEDVARAFPRRAPITFEIGSGDGDCILQLASRRRDENFLAAEVYRPGLGRLVYGAAKADLHNLLALDTDAIDLLLRIDRAVLDRILVFFPDPWPKKRHHKRRLLQREFFAIASRALHRHGRVFMATDCADYAESILETIDELPDWVNLAGRLRAAPRAKFRPLTKFERKAAAAGSRVFDVVAARR